jgi:two-component system, chemotaxis family, CheB/CheR fusion protein
MAQSAIARRVVDHIFPIAQIPAMLLAYAQHGASQPLLSEADAAQAETGDGLRAICAILRQATGHDFSHYKPATLLRRIAHRMQVLHSDALGDYIERLRQDRREVDQLFQDLLISVTRFFRLSSCQPIEGERS